MRNVTGRENLITCGQTNVLALALWIKYCREGPASSYTNARTHTKLYLEGRFYRIETIRLQETFYSVKLISGALRDECSQAFSVFCWDFGSDALSQMQMECENEGGRKKIHRSAHQERIRMSD